MAELVHGLVLDERDADLLLRVAVRLGRPHEDEIGPQDLARVFGPEVAQLFRQIQDFRFAADRERAAATPAASIGNLGSCNRCGRVINGDDAISTSAAAELLGVRPRRVRQLIDDDHAICAWQSRPQAHHQVSRASVAAHLERAGG
jgi:hypothetical protein